MFYAPHAFSNAAGGPGGAAAERAAAERAKSAVAETRHDIERLLMITEALWGILKEQHGYTDEELFRRITEIDLRDGRADGRVAATPVPPCPHCGRLTAKHRPLCIYCGKPMVTDPFQR